MNIKYSVISLVFSISLANAQLAIGQPEIYVNQNLGFNVPGYKYQQNEFPCNIDKELVSLLIEDGEKAGLDIVATGSAEHIHNGVVPVLAMDIEELILTKDAKFGTKSDHPLPKVQLTAAIITANQMETTKHTCAIATLNQFTPTNSVLDLGTTTTVCGATKKCLKDLSKDITEWALPQIKK